MRGLLLAGVFAAASFAADFDWRLPKGIPPPAVPADNPMNAAKIELGRHLFYDSRMSVNGTQSCASCHRQELAFTDGKARAVGATGVTHPRGAMSLANVAYTPLLTWANPTIQLLEDQIPIPMFGVNPVEMGMAGHEAELLTTVRQDSVYQKLFPHAFPGPADPFTIGNVVKAIAAFERTIISVRSPYDRYRYGGESNAISDSAKRGVALFFSERLGCSNAQCHSGWTFTGAVRSEGGQEPHVWYSNTGLYSPSEVAADQFHNMGLNEFTLNRGDIGRFRTLTLRNIAITAPYMHDGSIATLAEVIDHYAAGGRAASPNKSEFVRRFEITAGEKTDLIEFLKSLTDEELLKDPQWSDPWKAKKPASTARLIR
jgi:cytochrome c peroxidase